MELASELSPQTDPLRRKTVSVVVNREEEKEERSNDHTDSGTEVVVRTGPVEVPTDDVRNYLLRMRALGHRRIASAPSPSPPQVPSLASSPSRGVTGHELEEKNR